jgi:magnesium transporter
MNLNPDFTLVIQIITFLILWFGLKRLLFDPTLHILDATERYRDLLNGAMECYLTQLSHRTNESMRTLSAVATILLPLSLIAGVYGMNFDRLPGARHPWGFWVMLVAMGAVAVGLLWFFRRKRWL